MPSGLLKILSISVILEFPLLKQLSEERKRIMQKHMCFKFVISEKLGAVYVVIKGKGLTLKDGLVRGILT